MRSITLHDNNIVPILNDDKQFMVSVIFNGIGRNFSPATYLCIRLGDMARYGYVRYAFVEYTHLIGGNLRYIPIDRLLAVEDTKQESCQAMMNMESYVHSLNLYELDENEYNQMLMNGRDDYV